MKSLIYSTVDEADWGDRGVAIDEAANVDETTEPRIIVVFANPIPARTRVQIALKDVQPFIPGGPFFSY